jgi:dihydrofolate reductase
MSATVLSMSMSQDGFITGPNDGRGNGLGVDGHRLHDWLADGSDPASHRPSGASGEVLDALMATGAVVVGRRTFEIAGGWSGDHHDDVPIFVLTRRPPDGGAPDWPVVIYVTDVLTAMARPGPPPLRPPRPRPHRAGARPDRRRPGVTHLRYRVRR